MKPKRLVIQVDNTDTSAAVQKELFRVGVKWQIDWLAKNEPRIQQQDKEILVIDMDNSLGPTLYWTNMLDFYDDADILDLRGI